MKFIIDAQLPISLKIIFLDKDLDYIHTMDLPFKIFTTDDEIRKIAKEENRIIISKDNDFYESYILKSEPTKLI
jgi:predicted nuclease of predicted toxin-antitoxin system